MPRLDALTARPLSIALKDPFVIASSRVDVTRSVEVRAVIDGVVGLGEAACLPPVTREDQPDVLDAVERAAKACVGGPIALGRDARYECGPIARAGIETAMLDALARIAGKPLHRLLGGGAATSFESDITIAIAEPEVMAARALAWRHEGFKVFKVKVGKDLDDDVRALVGIARAVPDARFRVDANAGFTSDEAIALARAVERAGLVVECYEQPCAPDDLEAMARVADAVDPPVVADESVATLADLERVIRARAADGVNLKLGKSGGPLPAIEIGLVARASGLRVMTGGMVETRLGMTAAAHVVAALGGVDFVDLDTAWLLDHDPYSGGYEARGPSYTLPDAPGLGVRVR